MGLDLIQYRKKCVEFWQKNKNKEYIDLRTNKIVAIGDATISGIDYISLCFGDVTYEYISIGIEDIVFNKKQYFIPLRDNIWLALEKDLQKYFEQACNESVLS